LNPRSNLLADKLVIAHLFTKFSTEIAETHHWTISWANESSPHCRISY